MVNLFLLIPFIYGPIGGIESYAWMDHRYQPHTNSFVSILCVEMETVSQEVKLNWSKMDGSIVHYKIEEVPSQIKKRLHTFSYANHFSNSTARLLVIRWGRRVIEIPIKSTTLWPKETETN